MIDQHHGRVLERANYKESGVWKFKSIMNVNPEQGLCARHDMPIDSWYFCGRVKGDDGQEYNWLAHEMAVDRGSGGPQFAWLQVAVTSITKSTHSAYLGICPLSKTVIWLPRLLME
jgi:hypothetical protein